MDVVNLLSSLNKISLIAFLITAGFIVYQFYSFKKEISVGKTKPNIPDFKEQTSPINYTKVVISDEKKERPIKRHNKTPLVISVVVLIFLALTLLLSFINFQSTDISKTAVTPTPILNLVASKGIKIYNQSWVELTDVQLGELQSGQTVYIAIETVEDADIDKARIKVNKEQWTVEDITVKFNKGKNVFYQESLIGTDEAFLKIEGQLHSRIDGWLGD